MARNRYRRKAKIRKQYTLTGTKAFCAFWFSVFFSILLDSYFDKYGPLVLAQVRNAMLGERESDEARFRREALRARQAVLKEWRDESRSQRNRQDIEELEEEIQKMKTE